MPRDSAWNKMSPAKKRIEADRIKAIILSRCGEPLTTLDAMKIVNMTRSAVSRYFRQLEAEHRIKRIIRYKMTENNTHWLDGYVSIGSTDYFSKAKHDPSDIEGVTQNLLHWMGYGETKIKGETRDLTHYKNELETDGINWNPNVQQCLGGFSYGVGSGLL